MPGGARGSAWAVRVRELGTFCEGGAGRRALTHGPEQHFLPQSSDSSPGVGLLLPGAPRPGHSQFSTRRGTVDWTVAAAQLRALGPPSARCIHSHSHPPLPDPCCFCSATQSCPTVCSPTDCSMAGLSVLHCLMSLLRLLSIESMMPPNQRMRWSDGP